MKHLAFFSIILSAFMLNPLSCCKADSDILGQTTSAHVFVGTLDTSRIQNEGLLTLSLNPDIFRSFSFNISNSDGAIKVKNCLVNAESQKIQLESEKSGTAKLILTCSDKNSNHIRSFSLKSDDDKIISIDDYSNIFTNDVTKDAELDSKNTLILDNYKKIYDNVEFKIKDFSTTSNDAKKQARILENGDIVIDGFRTQDLYNSLSLISDDQTKSLSYTVTKGTINDKYTFRVSRTIEEKIK